ncbi:MAG: relaxase/mobilization nuclease domain-containing protein [Cyclobacteriaceae bacterium]|nr:relaxase/mobilization nuclease domain-containing protein [Cyclobacteriaceae bacterium]
MVAKVISGKTIRGALNYNENKVKEGVAHFIMANQFGCASNELTFTTKLNRFEKLIARNQKTKTNAIHISLNFDVTENLGKEKLCSVASTYMDKIGFGDQPYLVYQHLDAAHPLTTNIQDNGKRIDIHNIGRDKSEKARKEIEIDFNLVKAESKRKQEESIKPIDVKRAVYGKHETKRSIANVVRTVSRDYKYTSLPEYNAALRQFNVIADRGNEGSMMHKKKGFQYSLFDENGNKIGIPIKASSIYTKPTLPFLEKQFELNEVLRLPHKERLKKCIDDCFKNNTSITQSAFGEALQKEGIYVVLRQTKDGSVYGITFVDNKTKVVFNGSDLGKPYSAKALLDKISDASYPTTAGSGSGSGSMETDSSSTFIELNMGIEAVVQDLVTAKQFDFTSPDAAMKRRRKKKKRGRSL